jgi:hypothetical protein
MRARAAAAVVFAALAAAPAALAARAVAYQGWSDQGREIRFKVTKKGVVAMNVTVIVKCTSGQSVSYSLKALDAAADPISRKGRFTTILKSQGAPNATITGRFNSFGVGRGTVKASGPGKGRQGEDFGNCATEAPVRWTAGPA